MRTSMAGVISTNTKMFLFILLTVLTFINAFASKIVLFMLNLIPRDKSIETISSQIVQLKKEQSTISMIDEFAKHAKLQRRINKLLEEKKRLLAGHSIKIFSLKYSTLFFTYGVISITFFILIWVYKGEAVAQVPAEWLWPFPHIFSWFSSDPGCISVPSWIIISSAASKTIAKSF